MSDPCKQEAPIAVLTDRSIKVEVALTDIAAALKKNNELLTTLTKQGERIHHLREDVTRNEGDINELFGRVRSLELLPGKSMTKFGWLLLVSFISGGSGIVSGVVVWMVTHG